MLEQRRHAILNDVLQEVREASEAASSAHAGDVRDTGDEGEAMLQDALRFSLINMKNGIVIRIDRALERLAEGRYGTCDDCGEDIGTPRLRAMPFAARCRACEQLREDEERQRSRRPRASHWPAGESVVAPNGPFPDSAGSRP
jgi:DnaK suppressor protein